MRRGALRAGLLAILVVFPVQDVRAQLPLTIVAGPAFSNLSGEHVSNEAGTRTGILLAVGTAFPLTENVAIQPFLSYVQKGTSSKETDATFALDYFEIPVFVAAQFPAGESALLGVYGGPYVAFNIKCDDDGIDCSEEDEFNGTDYGFGAGASVQFPVSEAAGLIVGGGADIGLKDIVEEFDGKNRVFYLFAALNFVLGG